jgi:hypothetical protein
MPALSGQWRKSTRSGDNGACVEARYTDGLTQVRDSKNPAGPVLTFSPAEWSAFLATVKARGFGR